MEHATEIHFGTNTLNGSPLSFDSEPPLYPLVDPPSISSPTFSAASLRKGVSLLESVLVVKVISSAIQAIRQADQKTREEKPAGNEPQQGHPELSPAGAE